jgi:membrane associated rhomboid family serine protease
MRPSARTYWLAVAHERHGDITAARDAYAKARSRSRGRPRVLIDQALERLSGAKPVELGPTATEVVTRVEAQPPPRVADSARPPRAWAVRLILALMVVSAATSSIVLGQSTDAGVLLRDGALISSLVDRGEWWRLVSCIFVHVGGLHLLNLVALWIIGRFVEELYGGSRTLAIFGATALVASATSYFVGMASIAAGASGGLLGLLGALISEVTVLRRRLRGGWPRGLWGSLVLVAVAQISLGFLYPIVDQWAHAASLVAGLVLGLVLSPQLPIRRVTLQVARVLALAFAAAIVFSAVMVVQTSTRDSLERGGLERRDTAGYSAVVPATWDTAGDELVWRQIYIALLAVRVPGPSVADAVAKFAEGERERAKDKRFDQVAAASDTTVELPPGWEGTELAVSLPDPLETRQRFRVIIAGRQDADGVLVASIYVPETVVRDAPEFFTNLLASIRAR